MTAKCAGRSGRAPPRANARNLRRADPPACPLVLEPRRDSPADAARRGRQSAASLRDNSPDASASRCRTPGPIQENWNLEGCDTAATARLKVSWGSPSVASPGGDYGTQRTPPSCRALLDDRLLGLLWQHPVMRRHTREATGSLSRLAGTGGASSSPPAASASSRAAVSTPGRQKPRRSARALGPSESLRATRALRMGSSGSRTRLTHASGGGEPGDDGHWVLAVLHFWLTRPDRHESMSSSQ